MHYKSTHCVLQDTYERQGYLHWLSDGWKEEASSRSKRVGTPYDIELNVLVLLLVDLQYLTALECILLQSVWQKPLAEQAFLPGPEPSLILTKCLSYLFLASFPRGGNGWKPFHLTYFAVRFIFWIVLMAFRSEVTNGDEDGEQPQADV
ncbi:hypothetical protein AXG93_2587s1200 [Marchantia polymorpha subsp. ruderalis]|uniref:Uncharacterized protein n=1 Tax=Marchantia polymorpha subsp. ruderalis TaxID=1480154 RepID=A0A176WSA4_MARPO|nr:hypothetical protein AXG93_2587s1200 [Marchantia polymorpha subsp. ruderalis]